MSAYTSVAITLPLQLISLPAERLLEEFGAGRPSPGSGSAAALMGMLSAQLTATVCKISKTSLPGDNREFDFVLHQMEEVHIPRLKSLFQQDADDFQKVIDTRISRNNAKDEASRRRHRERELRLLRNATELVFDIVRSCISLIDFGIIAFDAGSKKVRGDSGAAISSAIAGAMSGLFIINLNLRSFQQGVWALEKRRESSDLQEKLLQKQHDAFQRIAILQPQPEDNDQPSLL